jgi:hypothetical protein
LDIPPHSREPPAAARDMLHAVRPLHVHLCIIAAVLLAGCPKLDPDSASMAVGAGAMAGSGPSNGSKNCSPLDGVYRFSYTRRSGTCDDQPEELVQFHNGASAPSASQSCQADREAMTSPCTLARDSMCSVSDPLTGTFLGTTHVTGMLTEVSDNTSVTGSFNVTVSDTSGASCQGVYDVTAVRVR